MVSWTIDHIQKFHVRDGFSCGTPSLDAFILYGVTQYEKRQLGRTYVATQPNTRSIAGYYTLAAGAVQFAQLPVETSRKLPRHPVPVVLLARLAVDLQTQGQRLGETLLVDALVRSLSLANQLGVHAVEVDAIDDSAADFYRKYGFVPLSDHAHHLYLPIGTIEKVFG